MVVVMLSLGAATAFGIADYCGGRAARLLAATRVTAVGELCGLVAITIAIVAMGTLAPGAGVWLRVGAGGIAGAIGQTLLYWALARGSMAVVAPVSAAFAALTPVTVGLATGERLPAIGLVGIALGVGAVALVSRSASKTLDRRSGPTALVAAVVAGCMFGGLFASLHEAPPEAGLWPLAIARMAALVLIAPAAWRTRRTVCRPAGSPARHSRGCGYRMSSAAGQLDAIGTLLLMIAMRSGLLSVVTVIAAMYPAGTVVLALAIDGERIRRVQAAGLALAGIAVALLSVAQVVGA